MGTEENYGKGCTLVPVGCDRSVQVSYGKQEFGDLKSAGLRDQGKKIALVRFPLGEDVEWSRKE